MIRPTWALVLLVASPAAAALGPDECKTLTDAHERFLFKELVIEGRAEYRDFEWR